ncbi:hypothetical protein GQ55_7G291400 [Panicum hallii var. hallii]|uniref:Ataxin 2 SM domain-containing protein n=2 Tax=Panicum hallii TaxID=206008 RepID=A0A2T7D078_9POAL|nr:uncharacterized protein LOC112899323 isoform X2 [Panicum hallii]PAN40200.1 hypothetical protein PAHAL_7G299000 [Panicum hallii]PUZ49007.1 hypothetical protein GQ55_7G291400 [Panicum hallii var. hallii]PVH35874.1 hypothetical protein PAHAL_7G299000 [Panicum hallii]
MARPRKAKPPPPPSPPKAAAPSLAEALLLATVCMVGLPVEVQVRDGSAYDGVLHTACVNDGYGVVLKKAKKIANGKGDANLSLGAFVDTLVVHPDDLVQVIAKGLTLPIFGRTPDCNVVVASGSLKPQTSYANDMKMSKTGNISPLEQVEKCTMEVSGNATSVSPSPGHVGPYLSMNGVSGSATMGPKVDVVSSSVIPAPMVTSDVKTSQPANNSATKIVTSSKTNAKEFKLNPCAKVFSPSFASSRQAHAAAPPVNSNYISHCAPEVPTGIPVYEPKSAPGVSSLSNKIHCSNLSPANYAISPQYVQSVVGHNASRLDPARIGTPYHPMQMGASYNSPSPQHVMTGKFSPVVYVHPISQDAIHGTPIGSQGWPRPVMLNSYQASMQKFQGNAPVYLAPQVMATGNLPLEVPSPAPLVQPFQAIHPIMVPAASSMIPGKYM